MSPLWAEANPYVNSADVLQAKKLVIGTKQSPPFAFKDQTGKWKGISIELWETIAEQLKHNYVFVEYDLQGLLAALENKSIDAAVAALTITSDREKRFDFTHPFYTSGLGIAVLRDQENSWLAVLNRFLSLAFLEIVFALVLLLFAVGLLVWFFERKKNKEQFGGGFLTGIGSGFWWSAVTMTTVGYGDKTPRTIGGRIVGLLWMFIAIIIISSFTAAITSTLTLNQIQHNVGGPEDLHRVKVGSMKLSTSASYLNTHQISFKDYPSVMDALQGLVAGEIDAVVYDSPILTYLVNLKMKNRVKVLLTVFEKQQYGIGLPTASPLREKINRLVPAITVDRKWSDILFRYLGEPAT